MNTLQSITYTLLFILTFFSTSTSIGQTCADINGDIWVTNVDDDGFGSLRKAIECANNTPGPNTIKFNILGDGEHRIHVGAITGEALPTLFDEGTIIDGSTETDFGSFGDFTPRIVLDGAMNVWTAPINAIFIIANNCAIYSIEITNFPDDGIDIRQANNVQIGAVNKGNIIYNCGSEQDVFPNIAGSWEGCGLVLRNGTSNCKVIGNIIGTDENLGPGLSNEFCGILNRLGSNNNIIGGENLGEANIVAYNLQGIRVDNSINVLIQQNSLFCNTSNGIELANNANFNKPVPIISTANTNIISGTANSGDKVEVFVSNNSACGNAPCQGRILLGTVIAVNGNWTLSGNPFAGGVILNGGEIITATATDINSNTSPFSACTTAVNTSSCSDNDGTIWVTNSNDDGAGSLRAAIDCANSTPGTNHIKFNIIGGQEHTIFVGSTTEQALPRLTDDRTIIDGTTQSGFGIGGNYAPKIILDGSQYEWQKVINAIWITGDFCEVYGLEITNFPDDGIDVTVGDFAIIGGVNKGNVLYNCGSEQDFFPLTSGGPWEGCAIVLKSGASNCIIQGNILGTNYEQNISVGNEYCGIIVQHGGSNNVIGGLQPGQGNIIAYNQVGIRISENSFNCRMESNSFYCNQEQGIELRGNANASRPKPVILDASPTTISGVANVNDLIEVFTYDNTGCGAAPCQGKTLIGRTIASNNGNWQLTAPFQTSISANDAITATSSDLLGNTSVFATCFSLTVPCALSANVANIVQPSCSQNNGSFIVNASGAGSYVYDIGNGPTINNTFGGLSGGSYSVTVTDITGCNAITGITLSSGNTPSLTVINQEDAYCNLPTGSFVIAASGGASPYNYNIGNGSTNNSSFSNLSTGTYTVTATDDNDCTTTTTVTISSTPSPTATISNVFHASCVENNGSFSVSVSGGTAPYAYNIGNGSTPNNTFSGLTPATYFVTVTDDNNCLSITQTVINGSSPPTAEVTSITDASCDDNNGGFTLDVSGGLAPYSFDVGDGSSNSPNFVNLAPGTYTVTITDANECEDIEGITVSSTSLPRGEIASATSPTCGQSNGSFRITILGGVAPYSYDYGSGVSTDDVISGVSAGIYVITVTDDNGCTDVFGFELPNSPPPIGSIESVNNANCNGENGSFTVGVSGGETPYTYDIGTGQSNNPTFEDLLPGNYNLTITDANMCTSNLVLSIGGASPPEVNIENVQNSTCEQDNGAFTISVSVGFPPYDFDIGDGSTTTPNFPNLAAGNYTVTITDANGCSAMENVTISTSPGPSANIESIEHLACGATTGSFSVQTTGGTTPYTYDIGNGPVSSPNFTELSSGTYTITISDATGCEVTETTTINAANGPSAEVINMNHINCGNTSGSFTVQASDGTSPYTYNIGNGSTTNPIFTELSPGSYDVSINDANNCETIVVATLTGSTTLDASFINVVNPSCGDNNGSFSILVDGGSPPFNYNIGFGNSTSPEFNNLFPDNFTVTVTDGSGCSGTRSVSLIDGGVAPTAAFTITRNDLTINLNNTTADATVYSWTFGDGSASDETHPVHTYTEEGEYTICLNVAGDCGSDVTCEPITIGIGVADPKANIGGLLHTETNQAVDLVEMTCTGQSDFTSDVTGIYEYNNLAVDESYTITPSKNINLLNGVSTFDLFKINAHILAEDILDSPYKIIAADVNNSGSVSGFDIIQLRKVVLGISNAFPNNTSWRFVPTDYEFPDPTDPLSTSFPESITVDLTGDVPGLNFVGIKIGDVNNSVEQGQLLTPEDRHQQTFELKTIDKKLKKNEIYDIIISSDDLKNLSGFQFTMTWDIEQLEIIEVQANTHSNFSTDNLGLNFIQEGLLTASWFSSNTAVQPNSSDLITLKVRAKSAVRLSETLTINSQITNQEAYRKQGTRHELEHVNLIFSTHSETKELLVHRVAPNPFSTSTAVHFSLPTADLVTLTIFDATGKVLTIYKKQMETGTQQILIDEKDLNAYSGVIFYQLRSGLDMVSGKMLRL